VVWLFQFLCLTIRDIVLPLSLYACLRWAESACQRDASHVCVQLQPTEAGALMQVTKRKTASPLRVFRRHVRFSERIKGDSDSFGGGTCTCETGGPEMELVFVTLNYKGSANVVTLPVCLFDKERRRGGSVCVCTRRNLLARDGSRVWISHGHGM